LNPESYRNLHRKILIRDGWRCQNCGSMSQLEVHHQQSRSHSGDDVEQNLITLCAECHALEMLYLDATPAPDGLG